MVASHEIESISFTDDILYLSVDGKKHQVNLTEVSKKLLTANEMERNFFKISPSGYSIH